MKVKEDQAKAREYYLSAYFLDPHFNDSEPAKRRIGTITSAIANRDFTGIDSRSRHNALHLVDRLAGAGSSVPVP